MHLHTWLSTVIQCNQEIDSKNSLLQTGEWFGQIQLYYFFWVGLDCYVSTFFRVWGSSKKTTTIARWSSKDVDVGDSNSSPSVQPPQDTIPCTKRARLEKAEKSDLSASCAGTSECGPEDKGKTINGSQHVAEPSKNDDTSSQSAKDVQIVATECTGLFCPGDDGTMVDTQQRTTMKDKFMRCKFVMPGIALKKMYMCTQRNDLDVSKYMAVLGSGRITMYRKERRTIKGMIMGSYLDKTEFFWSSAAKHLASDRISALCFFDNFATPIEEVSPTKFTNLTWK